jgi:hypothetical protein
MAAMRTRGGRELNTYHLPIGYGDKRAVERTAMRKRLLHTRWIGWGIGSVRVPNGYIGEAGERVVRASLRSMYYPVMANFGEVGHLFDGPVEGGAFDSAAWINPPHAGVPGALVLAPIEVKNLRHWLFPRSAEVHQLLYKAAVLQQRHPEQRIAPMLIARERNITLFKMAQDLGFFALNIHRQFMLPTTEITSREIEEVRSELGFGFLHVGDGPDSLLTGILQNTIPPLARDVADRWKLRGAKLGAFYQLLRDKRISERRRAQLTSELRAAAEALPEPLGGW